MNVDPFVASLLDDIRALRDRVERLERAKPIPSYATLADAGAAGAAGRVVFVQADGKLYRDTGTVWKSTDQT